MNALIIGAGGAIGQALIDSLSDRPDYMQGRGDIFAASRIPVEDARVHSLQMDVTDEASIQRAQNELGNQIDELNLLIVASGALQATDQSGAEDSISSLNAEALSWLYQVNTIGPGLIAKHFWPLLCHDQRAVFAAVSAKAGSIGDNRMGGWYGYRSSKAALNMLIRTIAIEMYRRAPNLICAALHPGIIDTPQSQLYRDQVPFRQEVTPQDSARSMLQVIDHLDQHDSGKLFAWDGSQLPW